MTRCVSRFVAMGLAFGALTAWATTARAGAGSFEGNYWMVGPSAGASFQHLDGGGFTLGGEVSAVAATDSYLWYGAYVDGLYDFGASETRLSIGPEFGYLIFGIDGGYLLAAGGAGQRHGVSVRPLLTFGLVAAYSRLGVLFGDQGDTFGEAGVLIKLPLWY